jgi:hypothetical protein
MDFNIFMPQVTKKKYKNYEFQKTIKNNNYYSFLRFRQSKHIKNDKN